MRTRLLFCAGILATTTVALVPAAAHAVLQVPPVTVFTDGGFDSGSLRAAITAANGQQGSSTIELGTGTYLLEIAAALEDANASGDLDISKNITINGAGRDATIIDAQGIGERAFDVLGGALTLTNLTVKNGSTSSNGGAIRVSNTSGLKLLHVGLDDNKATGNGGAISSNGPVTIRDSTLSGNKATGPASMGGAISVIATGGSSVIDRSTLSGNTAGGGGGAVAASGAALTIVDSTFSGNGAAVYSALWNQGGAAPITWLLSHVTVTGNTAASGGALAPRRGCGAQPTAAADDRDRTE
jgi:predicted outer membrane repeat protein